MEWVGAFFIGAVVLLLIAGLVLWIIEDPELAPWVIAFLVTAPVVGWLILNWFGWWDAWVYG